jgi:hypothetical protein
MTKHYLIFIHGIGQAGKNDTPEQSYDELWNRIVEASRSSPDDFRQRFALLPTDWHIGELDRASRELQNVTFGFESPPRPWFFNPMQNIRGFITFFIGDVVAYASEDVNFIRRTVWEQIQDKILAEGDVTYSIIAHSLGTAIAFDYVFELFARDRLFVPVPDTEKRKEDKGLETIELDAEQRDLLRSRFRYLFTLGSPIGLFMLRKGSLWIDVNPAFSELINPVIGKDRRWYNFWDSEDPIAYPLENLFGQNPANQGRHLQDIPVETGFLLLDSHTRYWQNGDVARKIAETITAFP